MLEYSYTEGIQMALTVQDLTKLQCFAHMENIAGRNGLNHKVSGVGILDYELMPEFADEFLHTFSPGDFILCDFLYQYCMNKPEEILPMVRTLTNYGAAGIGCKAVLYPKLPMEVLQFADENDFPVFSISKNVYFENIIYEITDALQTDDRNLLTTENIDAMILGGVSKNKVYSIAKNLSISFKDNCCVTYISGVSDEFREDMARYRRNFYLNRNFSDKSMIVPYKDGFFIILTSAQNSKNAFDIILKNILGYLGINKVFYCCKSRIHKPFESLDKAFRESYNAYLASIAEGKNFDSYDDLGVYEILVNDRNSSQMEEYMQRYIAPIKDKPDYMEAAEALVRNGGDIAKAADAFGCHQNTIRYKIARMRELTGSQSETENEFYMNLSLAVRIYQLRHVAK